VEVPGVDRGAVDFGDETTLRERSEEGCPTWKDLVHDNAAPLDAQRCTYAHGRIHGRAVIDVHVLPEELQAHAVPTEGVANADVDEGAERPSESALRLVHPSHRQPADLFQHIADRDPTAQVRRAPVKHSIHVHSGRVRPQTDPNAYAAVIGLTR
jgi:hypothetical protein